MFFICNLCNLFNVIFDVKLNCSLSQLTKENPCGGRIPAPRAVKVKETEEITEEAVTSTLRRALNFFSSIQAHDGHWPAESAGPLFFIQPLVLFLTSNPSLVH